jgi:hypothetical protein
MLDACPDTMIGIRDRALLALGFASTFRRSELVALEVERLTEIPDGSGVRIRRSKTDQSGEGHEIAIACGYRLRPVETVQAWRAAAEISSGPLFRQALKGGRLQSAPLSAFSAAQIAKRYAVRARLDPATYSGHSLRAGFLTSVAEEGASVFKMMGVSRHKSVDVLRGYVTMTKRSRRCRTEFCRPDQPVERIGRCVVRRRRPASRRAPCNAIPAIRRTAASSTQLQTVDRSAFVEKVHDIVGLYLNPPDHAVVLCVDEKSKIQAPERAQPVLPMGLGYADGLTQDYGRHGTTTLFAALIRTRSFLAS